MMFEEKLDQKYYGHYRAQIVEIDEKLANGIYKVRVYPFMAELEEEFLPSATSTLTVSYKHISLSVDDWVWVFFENGDYHYPVIWELCNIKNDYPKPKIGESYVDKYDKFQFGDIAVEFDEKNRQMKINAYKDVNGDKTEKWVIFIDNDKNGVANCKIIVKDDDAKISLGVSDKSGISITKDEIVLSSKNVKANTGYVVTAKKKFDQISLKKEGAVLMTAAE